MREYLEVWMSGSEAYEVWKSGHESEVGFWARVSRGEGSEQMQQWRDNLRRRADVAQPFVPWLVPLITTAPLSEAVIVDLAAGPVSTIGWQHEGTPLNIIPVDALAAEYDTLLHEAGIVPHKRTLQLEAERIGEMFAPGSIDLIHIRNALDHCYDVPAVIDSVLTALKPGASFVIYSRRNEGARERYNGLHQWDMDEIEGQFVIKRKDGDPVVVNDRWKALATVRFVTEQNADWFRAVVTKRQ